MEYYVNQITESIALIRAIYYCLKGEKLLEKEKNTGADRRKGKPRFSAFEVMIFWVYFFPLIRD